MRHMSSPPHAGSKAGLQGFFKGQQASATNLAGKVGASPSRSPTPELATIDAEPSSQQPPAQAPAAASSSTVPAAASSASAARSVPAAASSAAVPTSAPTVKKVAVKNTTIFGRNAAELKQIGAHKKYHKVLNAYELLYKDAWR